MSGWAAKRFWREAAVCPVEGGWTVTLDGREVRTPAKRLFAAPTRALAEAAAAEWREQGERIAPLTMPFTRSINAAIDKVAPQQAEVARLIASYGETDHLCYRAAQPAALRARQDAGWDPLLDWSDTSFGARLAVAEGVMPHEQDRAALARLATAVARQSPFELTALSDLVALTGSLILGLAVAHGRLSAAEAWALSRIDEEWQIEEWGLDAEAAEAASVKAAAMDHAGRFHRLSRSADPASAS